MSALKPKYAYNPEPRLSANQLSEYLTASPGRRKSIVKAAKFPKTVVVAHYDGAWKAIPKFLCDNARPFSHLTGAVVALKSKSEDPTQTAWVKDDSQMSVEAITAFQKGYNKLGLAGVECRRVTGQLPKLAISGVEISVALDMTVHKGDRAGGAVLMISKAESSARERSDRGRNSAVLAYLFSQQHLTHLGEIDRKLCLSIDVFGGSSYPCPDTFKRKISNMEDSCEEVALRWGTTTPPDDYDGPPWT